MHVNISESSKACFYLNKYWPILCIVLFNSSPIIEYLEFFQFSVMMNKIVYMLLGFIVINDKRSEIGRSKFIVCI